MEIHTPDKPIHSKKEFVFHMLTVVLGILIALGLDGIVAWGHHRALVHEARTNLVLEIRLNKETLHDTLRDIQKSEEQLNQIVAVMQQLETTRKLNAKELNVQINNHTLYAAAWHTAQTSGALTYMDYEELKQYNDIYDLQEDFRSIQAQGFNTLWELAPRMGVLDKDPAKVPIERYEAIEQEASRGLLRERGLASIAKALDEEYTRYLEHK